MSIEHQEPCERFHLHEWHPLVDGALQAKAQEVSHEVTHRVLDFVKSKLYTQERAEMSTGFSFAEVLLPSVFFGQAFPGEGWERITHSLLVQAAEETKCHPIAAPGLFGGTAGLATSVSYLAQRDARYATSKTSLDEQLARQVLSLSWYRNPVNAGVAAQDYDLISGASGILGYLVSIHVPSDVVLQAISVLLEYLVWLMSTEQEHERKRWYVPPSLYALPSEREQYPYGYYNCGLAHGIPGPLTALACAWQAGYQIVGQRDAMYAVSSWLVERSIRDAYGINWSFWIPDEREKGGTWNGLPAARSAWCYGSPGIARALWLGGAALGDASLCGIALESLKSVLLRPQAQRNIPSPTFCHGISGLLSICVRFANETHDRDICEAIPDLVESILALFDEEAPFGYKNFTSSTVRVDDVGWLTGASGVAMTLLSSATEAEPTWHSALLLASPAKENSFY